jgi:hypothetical protein
MIAVSNRVHLFAPRGLKAELTRCFTTVLGCEPPVTLDAPGLSEPILAFRFPGGGSVSIELTDDALDQQQARRGAWLELKADDPAALQQKVLAAGFGRVDYPATTTFYFEAPGGQVFGIIPARGVTAAEEMRSS